MSDTYKKKSYVPKEGKKKAPVETKTYEVILVKKSVLILSLNGNGYSIPIGKYVDKKIGDKIEM